ncbi:MAG: hypothetical protein HKO66_08255, partial [Saprospiraceae bacterium]|nr:hypothetical protein [Saprospiraceae bacterium]
VEFGSAEFQISYEKYFGERNSSFSFTPSLILKENFEETKSGYQLMGQYRIFLSHLRSDEGKAILGFYNIGIYGGLYGLYFDYEEDYRHGWYNNETGMFETGKFHKDIKSIEAGLMFGFQVDITERILIDFQVGGGIRDTDLEDTRAYNEEDYFYYDVFDPEYKGVKPKLGLQIGFTF